MEFGHVLPRYMIPRPDHKKLRIHPLTVGWFKSDIFKRPVYLNVHGIFTICAVDHAQSRVVDQWNSSTAHSFGPYNFKVYILNM